MFCHFSGPFPTNQPTNQPYLSQPAETEHFGHIEMSMAKVEVFENEAEKFPWLRARIDGMQAKGQVVIFAKSKQAAQARCIDVEWLWLWIHNKKSLSFY